MHREIMLYYHVIIEAVLPIFSGIFILSCYEIRQRVYLMFIQNESRYSMFTDWLFLELIWPQPRPIFNLLVRSWIFNILSPKTKEINTGRQAGRQTDFQALELASLIVDSSINHWAVIYGVIINFSY